MKYIEGTDRDQLTLFPESVDEYIAEDNPVRFLDHFVDQLSMKELGFTHTTKREEGRGGRYSYDPKDLLKLYLYGYLYQIRSSRKLERETHRNVEAMWLLKRLRPDFKTIADFRKENGKGIGLVAQKFTLLCKKLDLFGKQLIAVDGSYFKASANRESLIRKKDLKRLKKRAEERVQKYLEGLNREDDGETRLSQETKESLKKKILQMEEAKEELEELEQEMERSGKTQICKTDGDARLLVKTNQCVVGYNVQIAVDEKHKLIVTHDVVDEASDQNQLAPMALKSQSILQNEGEETRLDVLGDRGYVNKKQVKECKDHGLTAWVPSKSSRTKKDKIFPKEDFIYDPDKNSYLCPAGEELSHRGIHNRHGRFENVYETSTCKNCPLRNQCTKSKQRGRVLYRWEHEEVIEEMKQRVKKHPEMLSKRGSIVEHPFGTMKRWSGADHFLTRGLKNVRTEMNLITMIYNMKRVLNLVSVQKLIAAL